MNLYEIPSTIRAYLHPLVIIPAPHEGRAENGIWLALPQIEGVPENDARYAEIFAGFQTAINWWANPDNVRIIGAGNTPDDAFADLLHKTYPETDDIEYEMTEEEIMELAEDGFTQAALDAAACITEFVSNPNSPSGGTLMTQIQEEWAERALFYEDDAWINVGTILLKVIAELVNNQPGSLEDIISTLNSYANR